MAYGDPEAYFMMTLAKSRKCQCIYADIIAGEKERRVICFRCQLIEFLKSEPEIDEREQDAR